MLMWYKYNNGKPGVTAIIAVSPLSKTRKSATQQANTNFLYDPHIEKAQCFSIFCLVELHLLVEKSNNILFKHMKRVKIMSLAEMQELSVGIIT